ncbi:hypothetical protein AYI69_g10738 [Smittium culicis]|uniref:Uncharacterized protein n=1 Tax=Smittium culicis TaxID=133412 RepID=A0A1R1X3V9_9FUNG|nr:hypothetical protein AYI69_g10738 [Smittium culicis]
MSGVSLLGQINHTLVRKEIWGNYFPRIAWYSRENLGTLLENQYSTAGDVKHTELYSWTTRRGYICLPEEQESRELLQLVHRQISARTEFIRIQMNRIQKLLYISTFESDCASRAEGVQGTDS